MDRIDIAERKLARIAPILKWAGGKRQLLDKLTELLPPVVKVYCEPFFGGGALLFKIQPEVAHINDINGDLILVYETIKNDAETLIETLRGFKNEASHYYAVRGWDRDKKKYASLSDVEKAARILYLNKTCYNGLYRVNGNGEFNTPFGNYRNPNIVNESALRAVSAYLNGAEVRLTSLDYADVLSDLPKDAFVYLDPPYDPISETSGFTGYAKCGFDRNEQIRLRIACDELNGRGVKFMLSNSATDFIRNLYSEYNTVVVQAKRAINSDGAKRGAIDEIVVRNYG